MPGRTGLEILAEIRSGAATRDIPVVLLTGMRERELLLRGFSQGLDDFITKPADPAELALRIRAVAARSKRFAARSTGLLEGTARERTQLLWLAFSRTGDARTQTGPRDAATLIQKTAFRLAELAGSEAPVGTLTVSPRREGTAWVRWNGAPPSPSLRERLLTARCAAERLCRSRGIPSGLRLLHLELRRPELFGRPGMEQAIALELEQQRNPDELRSLEL